MLCSNFALQTHVARQISIKQKSNSQFAIKSAQQRNPCNRTRSIKPIAAMGSSAAVNASSTSNRHAALHDFCMCLPYGFLVAAGGLVSLIMGCGQPGVIVTVAGLAQLVLANLSLKSWKSGKKSSLYTIAEAGLAGAVAYYAWQSYQMGIRKVATGSLLGLSGVAGAFFVYNVLAGGNPPRRDSHEE